MYDTTIGWRFVNKALSDLHHPFGMGETAENVVENWGISREAQDDFAYASQQKYHQAHERNRFAEELVPVSIPQRKGEPIIIDKDEHPRPETPREKLGQLKPAFKQDGSVTAGNSSGINDGSSALLIVSEDVVKKLGLSPMAEVCSMAVASVSVPATRKALRRAGLDSSDLGLLSNGISSQSIACMQELELNLILLMLMVAQFWDPLGCSETCYNLIA